MNPKISIIVPVYNSERYLRRCIDSILSQTFTDYEVILVDDGSTDNSGHICDEYASNDIRIRVFHKENGGVASARQIGIDNAIGEYSIHADSDDWVEPNMLEQMYRKAVETDADVIVADFFNEFASGSSLFSQNFEMLYSRDFLKGMLLENFFGALWNKLIRHSLYKKFNVRTISGINYSEDVLLEAQIFKNNVSVVHLPSAFYHYNKLNENSITTAYTENTFVMRQLFISSLKTILKEVQYYLYVKYAEFLINKDAFQRGFCEEIDYVKCYSPLWFLNSDYPINRNEHVKLFIKSICSRIRRLAINKV